MPKTLLTEIQQASLVLFNVACLYTPAFTGFFSEIVPRKKLKKSHSPNIKNFLGKSFTIIGLIFGFLFAYGAYIMLLMSYHKIRRFFLLIYRLHYGFYKIDLECGDKNAVKPTLAEVFLGIRKKKSEEK
jgi:hypothetical protein